MKVLICGAGIAGNALAFWLSKLGYEITIIERFPSLRATGLQVDLRGPGIQVLRKMGLEETFRAKSVPEQGLEVVDKNGKRWGYFPANRTGKGLQSFTTDYEIMRGDFCGLLHDATKEQGHANYVFGKYVTKIRQREEYEEVTFSDGGEGRVDLVVGADGLSSRTRRMMLAVDLDGDANPEYHSLGACAGYCTINREMREGKGYNCAAFIATQNRGIMTRRHDPHKYQAYVFCALKSSERLKNATKGDVQEEKLAFAEAFHGAGWESESILQGLAKSDDFYCERMGVIQLDHWYSDRIAVVGDAAYCPSALTGMGTPSAIVGAYILAGEIGRHCASVQGVVPKTSITTALQKYGQARIS